ncbi:MAG: repair protein SbcC/Rad50 [Clostridiales bacterium]|nr:repair protein SbcC/Rad50 [Clostridiales bacterium]
MKLLTLTICGWGPYPGRQMVDFTSLKEGSMFLITGPTGCGKTTIFDAITFAIYGMVSGKTRDKASIRSDFAKDEDETYVSLRFLHRKKEVTVYRTPRYERKKKRGEGFVVQNETAELSIEGEPPITNLKEVNERLIQMMGLRYEQYKQIAMIAQGEFLELLLASSKERVEIFRNLFKTELYEQIQKKLSEEAKKQQTKIQEVMHRMEEARAMIDASGNEELALLIEQPYASYETLLELLKGSIHSDHNAISRFEETLLSKEEELDAYKKKGQSYFELEQQEKIRKRAWEEQEKKKEQALRDWEDAKAERLRIEEQNSREEKELVVRMDRLQAECQAAKEAVTASENLESEAGDYRIREERIRSEKERYLRLSSKIKAKEAQEKLLLEEQTKYQREQNLLVQIKDSYEEKERLYREAAIGIVARMVKEGEPCPVCGSMVHPQIALISEEVPDEAQLKRLKEKVSVQEKRTEEIYQRAFAEKGKLAAMQQEIEEGYAELSQTKETIREAYQELLQREKSLAEEGQLLQERKKKRLEDKNRLEKRTQELEQARQRQDRQREESQKRRLASYENESMHQAEFKKQEGLLVSAQKEWENAQKERRLLAQTINIEGILREQKRLEEERKTLQREKELLFSKQSKNEQAMRSIKEKLAWVKKREAIYARYHNLDQVTRGSNKDRIVFEHYVLGAYFEDVLQAANVRLAKMSAGRYELSKVRRVADARTTDSLELEVMDHYTGKLRPAKTLSGGEAFKAALSMALGLSDIIQTNAGGVMVETLFIDEGFGSLDTESLDQALETLLKLSGHNQTIGIISHVNELKERLDQQIVIQKEKNGSKILPLA